MASGEKRKAKSFAGHINVVLMEVKRLPSDSSSFIPCLTTFVCGPAEKTQRQQS